MSYVNSLYALNDLPKINDYLYFTFAEAETETHETTRPRPRLRHGRGAPPAWSSGPRVHFSLGRPGHLCGDGGLLLKLVNLISKIRGKLESSWLEFVIVNITRDYT